MTLRFLPVGPRTLLVELPDLDATLALFDALAADPAGRGRRGHSRPRAR